MHLRSKTRACVRNVRFGARSRRGAGRSDDARRTTATKATTLQRARARIATSRTHARAHPRGNSLARAPRCALTFGATQRAGSAPLCVHPAGRPHTGVDATGVFQQSRRSRRRRHPAGIERTPGAGGFPTSGLVRARSAPVGAAGAGRTDSHGRRHGRPRILESAARGSPKRLLRKFFTTAQSLSIMWQP